MRFSEAFSINVAAEDDWFDPHLTIDTRLFIDPLMMLEDGDEWAEAHDVLLDHFAHCYRLVAKAMSPNSLSAVAARRLLTFPEPSEFGLGYSAGSTDGAGSGAGFARRMADGIAVAIRAGLTEPGHIEEIGILNVGIGADRISDAVANVLKSRFIGYTQAVARRHGLTLERHRVRNIRCNLQAARWVDDIVELPTNPASGKPVILVPARFLNCLPTLNADDWFDSHFNADIRDSMNLQVGQHIPKAEIVGYARQHPDRVQRWAEEQTSRPDLRGYDFGGDPQGVVQWDRGPVDFALRHPIAMSGVSTQDALSDLIREIIDQYRHFVEDQRGWALLWNDDGSEKPESAAQLLFLGVAQHYLRVFDIEIDREVELGRGPVDFKASSGASIKVLIEIKKVHNGKFWNGLEAQLPIYLESDACDEGWYVALQYRSNTSTTSRIRELPKRMQAAELRVGKRLRYAVVDGRRKLSASKV